MSKWLRNRFATVLGRPLHCCISMRGVLQIPAHRILNASVSYDAAGYLGPYEYTWTACIIYGVSCIPSAIFWSNYTEPLGALVVYNATGAPFAVPLTWTMQFCDGLGALRAWWALAGLKYSATSATSVLVLRCAL